MRIASPICVSDQVHLLALCIIRSVLKLLFHILELAYNILGLCETSAITFYILRYQLIPHETRLFLLCLIPPTQNHVKKPPVALVRERTIPTERPPPVGEVSANFCG